MCVNKNILFNFSFFLFFIKTRQFFIRKFLEFHDSLNICLLLFAMFVICIENLLKFKIIFGCKQYIFLHCQSHSPLVSLFFILRYHEWNKATVREFLIHLSTSDSYLCLHVTSISVCSMEGPGLGFCPELWINSLKLSTKILFWVMSFCTKFTSLCRNIFFNKNNLLAYF